MSRNDENRRNGNRVYLVLGACAAILPATLSVETFASSPRGHAGAVYTMSNSAMGNEVIAFNRAADGTLTPGAAYATDGMGTGGGLGNQGGVTLSQNHRWLLAVNAGSNTVSVFKVAPDGLTLADVEPSLGERPVSVTIQGELVYVLNAAGGGSIQGFTIGGTGDMTPIADSMRPLSGAEMTGPAQIGFTRNGGVLVVTEKATNLIDTFVVRDDGTTSGPNVFASSGPTPFGFDFTAFGSLLVAEASGEAAGQAAASAYSVAPDGTLDVLSGSVGNFQTAACWLIVSPNSRYAYTTNTPAGTISGYRIASGVGSIMLLPDDGVTFDVGAGTGPLDADFSTNGRFLYTLNSGSHEIGVFRVDYVDGSLTAVQFLPGLPETANGMAAH